MSGYSSYVTLYDANENQLAIQVATAIPASTPLIMLGGSDGTNARYLKTTSDGTLRIDPTGTTSQPITDGGGSITIDGVVAATQSGTWTIQPGNTANTTPWLITINQGGNSATVTASNALKVDGSAVTQPISGTVTANQGGSWTAAVTQATAANLNAQVVGSGASGVAISGNPVRIAGSDGTNTRNILTDTSGRIIISPTLGTILSGFADGFIALTTNTLSAIRATTYNEQVSNAQRSVSSSSVNDSSAGTGARTIKIIYYDATGAGPNTVNITMNGTAAVNTGVTNICYIEKIEVLSVGSSGSNVGIITLFVGTGGAGGTIGTITAGANKTFWSHHYVQSGKTCFITSFQCNENGSQGALFHIRGRSNTTNSVEIPISDFIRPNSTSNGAGSVLRTYGTPIQVAGPARITSFVQPDQSITANYLASFDFYEQ